MISSVAIFEALSGGYTYVVVAVSTVPDVVAAFKGQQANGSVVDTNPGVGDLAYVTGPPYPTLNVLVRTTWFSVGKVAGGATNADPIGTDFYALEAELETIAKAVIARIP